MIYQALVTQPKNRIEYLSLFGEAIRIGGFNAMDVAVAYANPAGVSALKEAFDAAQPGLWDSIRKRWVLSIDYCRTKPQAIKDLSSHNSDVRIHQGRRLIKVKLCANNIPFHPKSFLFYNNDTPVGIINGSGNLTKSGLTRGHEVGTLHMISGQFEERDESIVALMNATKSWFGEIWRDADPANAIIAEYERICNSSLHVRSPVPVDDDEVPDEKTLRVPYKKRRGSRVIRLKSPDPTLIRKLRTAQHFWIIAGNNRNRGRTRPGTQIMMAYQSRVFFGASADSVDINSPVGSVDIIYNGRRYHDCHLRFSDNRMDVITLPKPEDIGVDGYELKPLHFAKVDESTFRMSIGTNANLKKWQKLSKACDSHYLMKGITSMGGRRIKREWGLY